MHSTQHASDPVYVSQFLLPREGLKAEGSMDQGETWRKCLQSPRVTGESPISLPAGETSKGSSSDFSVP